MNSVARAEADGCLTANCVALSTTRDYVAFGGTLRSELSFPALPETFGETPLWTLRVAIDRPLRSGGVPLGERRVGSET